MEVRYPPPQKGYLSDTCAISYENKANGCDTPSAILSRKGIARYGGVSRTGPLSLRPRTPPTTAQAALSGSIAKRARGVWGEEGGGRVGGGKGCGRPTSGGSRIMFPPPTSNVLPLNLGARSKSIVRKLGDQSPGNCSGSRVSSDQILLGQNFRLRPGSRQKSLVPPDTKALPEKIKKKLFL